MPKILIQILMVVLVSCAAAATANLTVYKMDWIRKPAPLPPIIEGATGAHAEDGTIAIDAMLGYLKKGGVWIVDARDPEEYADGHLARAINIPSNEVFDRAEQFLSILPPDAFIIVYCGGGGCESSHIVADALRRDFNFEHVVIYAAGWDEIEAKHDRFADYIQVGEGK